MSDQNIKVGDLVICYFVKACCGGAGGIGETFFVNQIDRGYPFLCDECGARGFLDFAVGKTYSRSLPRLIKISGIESSKTIETSEEQTA